MDCSECGFHLWSLEALELGAHPECLSDELEALQGLDLEEQLDALLALTA